MHERKIGPISTTMNPIHRKLPPSNPTTEQPPPKPSPRATTTQKPTPSLIAQPSKKEEEIDFLPPISDLDLDLDLGSLSHLRGEFQPPASTPPELCHANVVLSPSLSAFPLDLGFPCFVSFPS